MLFGEARSKVQHIAGALLRPDAAREMHEVFLARGALATTAIEGNTLSEDEVRKILEGELQLPPSQEYLAREVRNIVFAYNQIKDELVSGTGRPISPELLADYNRMILHDLELDEGVVAGEIATHPIVVGRYRAAPRQDCEYLLERLCEWLNSSDFMPQDADWIIPRALLRAIAAHLYLAWIHPYGDGNGRTARLVELRVLLEAGVPTPAAHLLSNHYNQTRTDYYRRLDAASRSDGGVADFATYALRGFVDGLHEQLQLIRDQQFKDRWEQYVYETFAGKNTEADERRRHLVLELSKMDEPIVKGDLRLLSPWLAEAYAHKTDKTVTRDVNALDSMGLIERKDRGYIARRHVIEAFLPVTADTP